MASAGGGDDGGGKTHERSSVVGWAGRHAWWSRRSVTGTRCGTDAEAGPLRRCRPPVTRRLATMGAENPDSRGEHAMMTRSWSPDAIPALFRRGQSAGLPRLDDPLPERRGVRGAAPGARRVLRPRRHADHLRARGRDRRARGRARRRGHRLRQDRDRPGADDVPQGRRPPADGRCRLCADPAAVRPRAQPLRRRDHLLRPADRRGHRAPDPRRTPGWSSWSRRARSPSRCRTCRRSPRSRAGAACSP